LRRNKCCAVRRRAAKRAKAAKQARVAKARPVKGQRYKQQEITYNHGTANARAWYTTTPEAKWHACMADMLVE